MLQLNILTIPILLKQIPVFPILRIDIVRRGRGEGQRPAPRTLLVDCMESTPMASVGTAARFGSTPFSGSTYIEDRFGDSDSGFMRPTLEKRLKGSASGLPGSS